MGEREAACNGGADRDLIGDESSGVVEQTLAFEHAHQPARRPEPAHDQARSEGVVGETIAPSAKAAPHGRPGTSACAAAAMATIVTRTSGTVLSASQRASARKSVKLAKIA